MVELVSYMFPECFPLSRLSELSLFSFIACHSSLHACLIYKDCLVHPEGQPLTLLVGIELMIEDFAYSVPEAATPFNQFSVFEVSHLIVGAYALVRLVQPLNIFSMPEVPTSVMLLKSGPVVRAVQP